MKKIILFSSLLFILGSCKDEEKKTVQPAPDKKEDTYVWEKDRTEMLECRNMVLLYSGGTHRTFQWDENHLQPNREF